MEKRISILTTREPLFMGYLRFLLVMFLGISFLSSYSQQKYHFETRYTPETTLLQTTSQKSRGELRFSGSDEIMTALKENGVENPTPIAESSYSRTMLATGPETFTGYMPLTITFKEHVSNGESPIPDGTQMFGKTKSDGLPEIDSVDSDGQMDPQVERMLPQMITEVFQQIDFPKKALSIGESFTHDQPLSLPMGGVLIEMNIASTYKLSKVEGTSATFELNQTIKMTSKNMEVPVVVTGTGEGIMVHDLELNYMKSHVSTLHMEVSMERDGLTVELEQDGNYEQTVTVVD